MMQTQILYPTEVHAFRIGNENKITIVASGHEDGYINIRIVKSPATIYPPIFMVEADLPVPSLIGYFPYTVRLTVPYNPETDYINFTMKGGDQRIKITKIWENAPDAITKATPKQVVGYAYNSTDINVAISDAVSKLQALSPGKVNAVIKTSGFVAAGLPIGIAYFYVVMESL